MFEHLDLCFAGLDFLFKEGDQFLKFPFAGGGLGGDVFKFLGGGVELKRDLLETFLILDEVLLNFRLRVNGSACGAVFLPERIQG